MTVIGAGLAGSEAAWQVAQRGINVDLIEMRPHRKTPAHHTGGFAELVCSNSLRAEGLTNAVGLLKEEMRRLDSLIMACADATRVPAGGALAVDREGFSQMVTQRLVNHPRINIIGEEVTTIPAERPLIIASGPLTSPDFASSIAEFTHQDYLYFYDAAAPIVTYDSIDMEKAFAASRYDRGENDYLNCPMSEAQYHSFWQELVNAETVPLKEFETEKYFEGCMPIEEMARRGEQTLSFGPLKPVGLTDPRDGKQPHAVVQLRQDNKEGSLYNMVGFQTHLKWGEQKRIFRMIPGLENAEFVRFGVMHRNTYINSPTLLEPTLEMKSYKGLFFAGQISGVEGYIESAAMGLVAGINASLQLIGEKAIVFPEETAHGALCHYITTSPPKTFQPMNVNFGLLPPWPERIKNKREKYNLISERGLASIEQFKQKLR